MGTGTEVGRVRGLGSAKHGAGHWLHQRLTAVANILLVGFLVASLFRLPGLDHKSVVTWLSSPLVAVALILMTVSVFWHLRLGLQVFIEDYVHEEGSKLFLMVLLTFYAIACPALAIFSILKIAFGSVAA